VILKEVGDKVKLFLEFIKNVFERLEMEIIVVNYQVENMYEMYIQEDKEN
jgi:hypothetical protein